MRMSMKHVLGRQGFSQVDHSWVRLAPPALVLDTSQRVVGGINFA